MRQETMSSNRVGAPRTSTAPTTDDVEDALPWESPTTPTGVSGLTDDRLTSEIIGLTAHLSAATYDLLVLIGELDDRGTYALSGALSCAAWLADRCDIERVTAHNQVRVARAMRAFDELDTAMASGDISYAKARWSHRHESQDDIDRRHHDERSVSWRTDPDGMIRITARLAPAEAAAVCAMIDKTVTTTPTGADRDSGEGCPGITQQRADALVAVVTQRGTGSVDTEIVVHVSDDGNTLADGTPLTDHAVTELLPEAFVSLLLLDKQRHPIDASPRRRFPTRRQRRVVDARQDQCQHPGCHARALLQYDHIQPYPLGGPTVVDNLQRLCGPHNRAKYRAEIGASDG